MKLRTKITVIAGIVILLAAAVSDGVIWGICRRALLNETRQTAIRESAVLRSDYQALEIRSDNMLTDQEIVYFLKQRADDYVISMRAGKMLFNHTVLTADDLYSLKTAPLESSVFEAGHLTVSGHPLYIVEATMPDGVTIYSVTDLSSVYRRLRLLALEMSGVLLCVGAPAVIVLYLLLRRTMKPLGVLSDSAKLIAAGAYEQRAAVSGNDEIGLLARDFNLMADAVQEKISALKDSEQRKTMFMADFSHELKTPLTAISGYAQTLRTVKLSEEDSAEALGYIYTESKRLDRLAKKMMRLMQLDRTASLQMLLVDNIELLRAAAATCQPFAERKGVDLRIGECSGTLSGDFDLLQDALCDLADNAIKASEPGQTVTLSAANHMLTVADEGCGIPKDEIRNLTEPFYMVDKSRSRQSGGAGLGLSLVKQIAQLHGAELEIESAPGEGTTVKLHFVYTPLNT